MKYLIPLLFILVGCEHAPVNSEYWHGCLDATKTIVGKPTTFKDSDMAHFCDAMEEEYKDTNQKQKFMRDQRR